MSFHRHAIAVERDSCGQTFPIEVVDEVQREIKIHNDFDVFHNSSFVLVSEIVPESGGLLHPRDG